jgi:predicted transcriptional regulator
VARISWFDEDSDLPIIEEKVHELESFTKAMADGVIEKKELEQQQERLVAAMKAVETKLDDKLHAKVTELLVELTAYDIMRLLHELQTERARVAFSG